jgi:hypothetical protein
LLGENDIEVALQKLDQLTLFEGQMIAAQILKRTDGLVQDMREVKDGEKCPRLRCPSAVERPSL